MHNNVLTHSSKGTIGKVVINAPTSIVIKSFAAERPPRVGTFNITGSTAAWVSPVTPNRRFSAATAASRSCAVPAVAGYPDAEAAAANAS